MHETVARTERIKELFARAMTVAPADRPAMLDRECDDPGLKDAVAALLNDYDSAQQFFAQFPGNFARQALGLTTTPSVFAVDDLVAGRFRIVGFLGAGGMGEVYEAEDEFLNREHVALKTLPTDISRDPRAIERLKRELALARKVTHPNVCRVFDVDEHTTASGIIVAFFTMELLKGETLAARLTQRGPLSTTEVRPLIAQMVAALGAAHAAGVVHGDLKPGNIVLVPSGDGSERVVVADFGLARQDAAFPAQTSGGAWGTPVYMAPEQFAGQRPTRATDVYALAAVVLEMLTGKRPFERDAAVRTLAPSWRAAIDRGLAHDPSARFDTADGFLRALTTGPSARRKRWPLAAAVAALLVTPLLLSPVRERLRARLDGSPAVTSVEPRNVVVLPFTASASGAEADALARGLSATIAEQLGAIVTEDPRLLFLPLATGVTTPPRAHRTLGADVIVTGKVDGGPRARVTIERHGVSAQQVVLERSQTLEIREGEAMLPRVRSVVAELLGTPSTAIAAEPSDADERAAMVDERYVLARGFLEQGRQSLEVAAIERAIDAFQSVIALDSERAAAHAALSDALVLRYEATKDTNRDTQLLDRAERSAAEAIRLQPATAAFHVARAQVFLATGRHPQVIPALEEALRLDPGSAIARELIARSYEATAQLSQAEQVLERGVATYPRSWSAQEDLGVFRLNRGQYARAETHFLAGRALAPDNPRVIRNLAALYMWTELFDAAEQELRRGIDLDPDPTLYNNLAWAYFYQEKFVEGLASLEKAAALTKDDSVVLANLARAYRWVKRPDRARAAREVAFLAARKAINADPRNVEVRANLAYLFAETGDQGEAGRLIARALDDAPGNVRVQFMSAIVFDLSGRRDAALAAVEAAIAGGHPKYDVAHHPDLRALRSDPRYVDVIDRKR